MRLIRILALAICAPLLASPALAWDCQDPAVDCSTVTIHDPVMQMQVAPTAPAPETTVDEASTPDDPYPDDPYYGAQEHFNGSTGELLDIESTWDVLTTSRIIVAVIDSGIDYEHEDLRDNMWVNIGEIPANGIDDDGNGYVDDMHGYNFHDDDPDPYDEHMHGTHVAGIIGAVGNNSTGVTGLLWNTELMALRFTDGDGVGNTIKAVEAIHYAVANGARVINLSWTIVASTDSEGSQALNNVIHAYKNDGIVFVAAAGNGNAFFQGINVDEDPVYPAAIASDNLITVAAADANGELAAYSNYGATTVDVMAPGTGILSTFPEDAYGQLTGTSAAAGFVSAAAAYILAQHPELSASEVRERILDAANFAPELVGLLNSAGSLNIFQALNGTITAKDFSLSAQPSAGSSPSLDTASLAGTYACQLRASGPASNAGHWPILMVLLLIPGILFRIRHSV